MHSRWKWQSCRMLLYRLQDLVCTVMFILPWATLWGIMPAQNVGEADQQTKAWTMEGKHFVQTAFKLKLISPAIIQWFQIEADQCVSQRPSWTYKWDGANCWNCQRLRLTCTVSVSVIKLMVLCRENRMRQLSEIDVELYGVCFSDQADGVRRREQGAAAAREVCDVVGLCVAQGRRG